MAYPLSALRRRGAAAPTLEDARASAAINDQLAALWREAGDQAGSIFVLQQLEMVLQEAAGLAGQMQLGRITALETGNPAELANLASLHPAVMRTFLEQVRDTLGIDVLQALNPQRTPQPRPSSSPCCCSPAVACSSCVAGCTACWRCASPTRRW